MSFSLGNFCGNLCGTLIEKLTCSCNCINSVTNNEIASPEPNNASAAQVAALNFDLQSYAEQCHAAASSSASSSSKSLAAVPVVLLDSKKQIDRKMQWISSQLLGANPADMLARIEYVMTIAGVDFQKKYRKNSNLTEAEDKSLTEQVNMVKKYGSLAAQIWKSVRSHKVDWSEMSEEFSKEQIKLMRKKCSLFYADSITARDSFSKVDIAIKKVFVEAAALFPSAYLKQNEAHVAWDTLLRANSSEGGISDSSQGSMTQQADSSPYHTPQLNPRGLLEGASQGGPVNHRLSNLAVMSPRVHSTPQLNRRLGIGENEHSNVSHRKGDLSVGSSVLRPLGSSLKGSHHSTPQGHLTRSILGEPPGFRTNDQGYDARMNANNLRGSHPESIDRSGYVGSGFDTAMIQEGLQEELYSSTPSGPIPLQSIPTLPYSGEEYSSTHSHGSSHLRSVGSPVVKPSSVKNSPTITVEEVVYHYPRDDSPDQAGPAHHYRRSERNSPTRFSGAHRTGGHVRAPRSADYRGARGASSQVPKSISLDELRALKMEFKEREEANSD